MSETPAKRQRKGPPSTYTPEKALTLCEGVANGKTIRSICSAAGMPDPSTIRNWLLRFPDFRELYHQARIMQSHALFDEIMDYSHALIDTSMREDGMIYKDREAAVAIRALQWSAGKLNPSQYGEHIPHTVATSVSIHTSLDMNVKDAQPVVGGKTQYVIDVEPVETAEERRVRELGEKDGKKAIKRPKARKPKQSKPASKVRAASKALPPGENSD